MDYISGLPLELLDEIAYDELTYRALLSVPQFARSITIGRRFDFMVKFGHDFHVKQQSHKWHNEFTRYGKQHRINGPTREHSDGNKAWYVNGKRHRENGPAIEWPNGDKAWYINGNSYTEQNYWQIQIAKRYFHVRFNI